MSIYYNDYEKDLEIAYKIATGTSAISYRLDNGLVLKKYIDTCEFRKINALHKNEFYMYLSELSKVKSDILVTPKDIYLDNENNVLAQVHTYESGMNIDDMYPKTNLDNLFFALKHFFDELKKIDYLKINIDNYKNILYTGLIKILDLDMSSFDDSLDVVKNNIIHINNLIIRGLFDLGEKGEIVVSKELCEILKSTLNGEVFALDFLEHYRAIHQKNNGECDYIKQLSKNYIWIR